MSVNVSRHKLWQHNDQETGKCQSKNQVRTHTTVHVCHVSVVGEDRLEHFENRTRLAFCDNDSQHSSINQTFIC